MMMPAYADTLAVGNARDAIAVSRPLVTTVAAKPKSSVHLNIAGSMLVGESGSILASVRVDHSHASITTGIQADQFFQDPQSGARYYGYFLSLGVQTAHQTKQMVKIQIQAGENDTPHRSYYRKGNGGSSPMSENELQAVAQTPQTLASVATNTVTCGTRHRQNGMPTEPFNCEQGMQNAHMDLTQYVKVLPSDPEGMVITSHMVITAVME